MFLRKLNAVLSLIATILVLVHAVSLAIWMITKGAVKKMETILPRVLMGVMILHALISILLGVLGHKNAEKRKCNEYQQLNLVTMFQRIGGTIMIVFTAFHILGAVGVMQPSKLLHIVLSPLFFTIVLAHVAISTSKAFITLGIGSAKSIKIMDIIIKAFCLITLIISIIGFYLFSV